MLQILKADIQQDCKQNLLKYMWEAADEMCKTKFVRERLEAEINRRHCDRSDLGIKIREIVNKLNAHDDHLNAL